MLWIYGTIKPKPNLLLLSLLHFYCLVKIILLLIPKWVCKKPGILLFHKIVLSSLLPKFPGLLGSLATPIKYLDIDDKCSQIKLETGCILFSCFIPCFGGRHHFIIDLGEEGPYHWQFRKGGPISLAIWDQKNLFLVNLEGSWWRFVITSKKTMLAVGWTFIIWSKLYLEGLSSRSWYFI